MPFSVDNGVKKNGITRIREIAVLRCIPIGKMERYCAGARKKEVDK